MFMIDVSKILGKNNANLEFSIEDVIEDMSVFPQVVKFVLPVKVEGTVSSNGDVLLVEAKGTVESIINCDRCLTPVIVEVSFSLNEKFASAGSSGEEVQTFSGNELDISDAVKNATPTVGV